MPPACGHGQRGLAPRLYLGVEAHGHAVHHVGQEEDGGLVPRDHWRQVLLSSYTGLVNIYTSAVNEPSQSFTLSQFPSYQGQGDSDGRGKQTASPMLTAIMSGGVGTSGRELSAQLIKSLEQANHSFS